VLHRLAESDEAALVVERAPAPHISAGDPALEWRLGPACLRAGLDRNHILMRQQHDRWDTRIGSRPLVQQTIAVHFLELQRGMELWKRGSQIALEAIELTGVELARILKGDGLEAQRAGQALRARPTSPTTCDGWFPTSRCGNVSPPITTRITPETMACSRPSCGLRPWHTRLACRDSPSRTPTPSCTAASPGAPGRRPPPRRLARASRRRDSDS